MLSVIICSISPERLRQVESNIGATIGVEYEVIAIDNRETRWPIARVYNEGARRARYPYLFFVHEDIRFHSQGWGAFIERKLKEPGCGVIGFAGSKVMFDCYSGWMQHRRFACACYIQRREGGAEALNALGVAEEAQPFTEVVTLDGLGLFVRRELWRQYPFDEALLAGFHCYDVDFTLQIAFGGRYKNYVCHSPEVLIEHFSQGSYNEEWCRSTISMYHRKWNKMLPLKVESLRLSGKEMKRYREKSFDRFVRKALKVDFPEKRAVLKAFWNGPFSWEHLGHCLLNTYRYLLS